MSTVPDTLRQVWLFVGLNDAAIARIAQDVQPQNYHSGQYVFHEHTPRDAMYIVQSGQVNLLHGIGQRPVTVATLGPGDVLGERLLLNDPTHVLSAQAISDVSLLCIPKTTFDRLAETDNALYETLVQASARRLSDRLQAGIEPAEPGRSKFGRYRMEHDLLGEREVPAEVLYGIQTLRAIENFPITGIPIGNYPYLVEALGCIKQAAARANFELGLLDEARFRAIETACEEARTGCFNDQFPVDVIQGGAGTSTNMNANEVIANRGLELLGRPRGDYTYLHPLNHVNMSAIQLEQAPSAGIRAPGRHPHPESRLGRPRRRRSGPRLPPAYPQS